MKPTNKNILNIIAIIRFSPIEAVTANHIMIDLQNDDRVRVGDDVVLIDNDRTSGLTDDVLADLSGVSYYKTLIGLNPLLPRKYISS